MSFRESDDSGDVRNSAFSGSESAASCRYCAGKGGCYRLVYSRFLGCEPQVHEGLWEKCWARNGTGKEAQRVERV